MYYIYQVINNYLVHEEWPEQGNWIQLQNALPKFAENIWSNYLRNAEEEKDKRWEKTKNQGRKEGRKNMSEGVTEKWDE
jgi:hypothetical protein